ALPEENRATEKPSRERDIRRRRQPVIDRRPVSRQSKSTAVARATRKAAANGSRPVPLPPIRFASPDLDELLQRLASRRGVQNEHSIRHGMDCSARQKARPKNLQNYR